MSSLDIFVKEFQRKIMNCEHGKSSCCSSGHKSGVSQSLSEMEFERGIWYAAQTNDLERVKLLLRKGTSPDVQDNAGYTALHYAARNNNFEICKELLENKADVNAVTKSGRATALHRAATQGHAKIVELLLRSGADVDLLDADNCSALHRAVAAGKIPICKLLVENTKKDVKNNAGLTPFEVALKSGNSEIVSIFKTE